MPAWIEMDCRRKSGGGTPVPGACGKDRGLQPCGGPLPPLPHRCGAADLEAVVREDETACRTGSSGSARARRRTFVPPRFTRVYENWLENIRDWCISRQLWWGHRIPAWYCPCGEVIVDYEDPKNSCPSCGAQSLEQDPDVLDTWFSSALWPFSTLGWPEETADLARYFPTAVLVTAYDIIFFWVARMIFMSLYFMKEVPFKVVYIHGLVRDSTGPQDEQIAGQRDRSPRGDRRFRRRYAALSPW
jgi:valyl-tRNA synthetase